MTALLISSTESSAFQFNAPDADECRALFVGASLPTGAAWVGPAPRIVRELHTGSPTAGFVTKVAWLVDSSSPASNTADYWAPFARSLQGRLNDAGDWSTITVEEYSPALHGSYDWWQSGQAADTRTASGFGEGAARFDAPENPTGPNTQANTRSPFFSMPEGAKDWGKALLVAGAVAAGGFALFEVFSSKRRK